MQRSGERVAVITGAGGAIGRATATALGSRGFGVVAVDLESSAAEETADAVGRVGAEATAISADVSDDAAVERIARSSEEAYGGIDAWLNNAGVSGAIASVPEYPLEAFEQTMAVNVRGVFLGMRHAIPALRRRGGGAIVNISSQAGLRGVPNLSAYSASKHAVIGLTRGAALEVAGENIRINAVAPGPTDTRMMTAIEDEVRSQGGDPAGFVDRIPVGRYGEPHEIAALIAWLLADAPSFLIGAVLPVDGGMTVP
jgi:NAD(P)-dependent dehydrogenase (short-subunit alcohol dehydrogenase family)